MAPKSNHDHLIPCIQDLYYEWLTSTRSLRKIGAKYGIDYQVVWGMFKALHGPFACSPEFTSLARAAYRDDPKGAERSFIESLLGYRKEIHRPQRTMRNLSKFKTVFSPERIDKQVSHYAQPWEYVEAIEQLERPLRWFFVSRWIDMVASDLKALLEYAENTTTTDTPSPS